MGYFFPLSIMKKKKKKKERKRGEEKGKRGVCVCVEDEKVSFDKLFGL